jgi:hypothetical protein
MAKTRVRAEQLISQVATEQEVDDEIASRVGVPNGLTPLGADNLVPMQFLPAAQITDLLENQPVDGGEF